MTKKGIFDVDGIGDFNNPDLLRPVQKEIKQHNIYNQPEENFQGRHTQRRRAKQQSTEPPKQFNTTQKPDKNKPKVKRKGLRVLWIIFSLLTIGFAGFLFYILQQNNFDTSRILLNTTKLSQVGILVTVWGLLLLTLLFMTNKKLGAYFLIFTLLGANFSAFKANELVSGFQKLFSSNSSNQTTAIKTSTKNILTEPFTVLVLGVDADDSESPKSSSTPGSGYRSDTMILVSVNPSTHKADMITTPRDTFLQDSCSGSVHKLTEFIGNGVSCTINTIESLYNTKIDYFVQANFTAVVQIVDALGGIEVNVPDLTNGYIDWLSRWISLGGDSDASVNNKKLNEFLKNAKQNPQWCDVDSHRNPYAVCFNQFGTQNIDGEHALAFARSRHYDSDYARGMRQTEVIRAIIQKMASPSGLFKIQTILEKLKKSYAIETNMTFSQMTDIMSYSESLSGHDTENFQVRKYQPLGTDNTPYEGSGILLYKQSVLDIRKALAMTLGTAPPAPIAESEYYDTIEYPSFKTN